MRYKGCIVCRPQLEKSYIGEPTSRSQELEITYQELARILPQLLNIPICTEHHDHARIGRVTKAYMDVPNKQACVEFELDNTVAGSMGRTLIDSSFMTGLSLKHNRITLQPLEVSLCFRGARPNTFVTGTVQASVNSTQYIYLPVHSSVSHEVSAAMEQAPAVSPTPIPSNQPSSLPVATPPPTPAREDTGEPTRKRPRDTATGRFVPATTLSDADAALVAQIVSSENKLSTDDKHTLMGAFTQMMSDNMELQRQLQDAETKTQDANQLLGMQQQTFLDSIVPFIFQFTGQKFTPEQLSATQKLASEGRGNDIMALVGPPLIAASASAMQMLQRNQQGVSATVPYASSPSAAASSSSSSSSSSAQDMALAAKIQRFKQIFEEVNNSGRVSSHASYMAPHVRHMPPVAYVQASNATPNVSTSFKPPVAQPSSQLGWRPSNLGAKDPHISNLHSLNFADLFAAVESKGTHVS